jgi:uncharacterized protein YqfB (UPF0267 family)
MAIEIRVAERKQSKLRIGLSSPSGGGKTFSALLLAKGLVGEWGKIGLIDSENGRGDFYSDLGKYRIITLRPPFTPESYIEAIRAFENVGVDVIIVDSVTHEWDGEGGCLQLNEKLAIAKYKGNTWSAWSETTPRHQRFLDAITSSTCHMITTVRNKVETEFVDGKVKKIGMKEIQREGFEYELTVNFTIDRDSHAVMASKDNTNLFEGRDPFIITEQTGETLRDWVASGAADKTAEEKKELRSIIKGQAEKLGKDVAWVDTKVGFTSNMTVDELKRVVKQLRATIEKNLPKADPASEALKTSAAKHITPTV